MGNSLNTAKIDEKIAYILDSYLNESPYSLRKLSDASGIKLTRLGDVLRRGRAITTGELQAICEVLDLSPWRVLKQAEESLASEMQPVVNNVVPFPKRPREPLKPELTALPEMA